ncbi:MAG: hypothetical protein NT169_28780 [Chloroflexi bacterium]|nr:hypothetical protein [Chloroflexota bacterium]
MAGKLASRSETVILVRRSGDDAVSVTIGGTEKRYDWRRAVPVIVGIMVLIAVWIVVAMGTPQQVQALGVLLRGLTTGSP